MLNASLCMLLMDVRLFYWRRWAAILNRSGILTVGRLVFWLKHVWGNGIVGMMAAPYSN